MKTLYITQGGALEDYLSESNSQGGGYGNGNKDECQIPFTPCWCETRPNNPNCDEQPPAAPIDHSGFAMLILFLIGIVIYTKYFDKHKDN